MKSHSVKQQYKVLWMLEDWYKEGETYYTCDKTVWAYGRVDAAHMVGNIVSKLFGVSRDKVVIVDVIEL